jgi:putative spermidine/putrescine transport system permease protein
MAAPLMTLSPAAGTRPTPDLPLLAHDGVPLAQKLAQVTRKSKIKAFLLVAPLLLFVILFFVVPIGQMLRLSIADPVIATELPLTTAQLAKWNGQDLPGEVVFAALAADAKERQATGKIGAQINYIFSGARSLFVSAGRGIAEMEAPFKKAFIDKDPVWGDPVLWTMIKTMSKPTTPIHYLNATDRTLDGKGAITGVPEDQRIHITIFLRTLWL